MIWNSKTQSLEFERKDVIRQFEPGESILISLDYANMKLKEWFAAQPKVYGKKVRSLNNCGSLAPWYEAWTTYESESSGVVREENDGYTALLVGITEIKKETCAEVLAEIVIEYGRHKAGLSIHSLEDLIDKAKSAIKREGKP